MAQPIDVKLTQDDDGIFDINIGDNGDFELDEGFGTTIALTIFGEQRASEGEVPTPENRGGWIGNILADDPGFQAGSKGWLLKQSRLKPSTPSALRNYHQEALRWMIDDGLAKKITITSTQTQDSINQEINVDGEPFFFDVWNNTIL